MNTLLGRPIELIVMAGREIDAAVIDEHQPDILLVRSVTPVNKLLLDNNKSVKFVGSTTIGIDHVDVGVPCQARYHFCHALAVVNIRLQYYVVAAIANLRPDYLFKPINLGIIGWAISVIRWSAHAISMAGNVLGYDPLKPPSVVNNAKLENCTARKQCD